MASVSMFIAAGTVHGKAKERLEPGFEALVDRYLEEVRGVGVDREPDTMSADSFARRVQVARVKTPLRVPYWCADRLSSRNLYPGTGR